MPVAPKTPQRRLTYDQRACIHALRYYAGWSYSKISYKLNIPARTLRYCSLTRITP